MARASRPTLDDLLPRYAGRARVPWEILDDRAVIVFPKQFGPFERLVARLVGGPRHVRVTLDEVGTATWLLADGTRTVSAVAEALRERLGSTIEPAEARSAAFLQGLRLRGLIALTAEPTPADDSLRGLTPEQGFVPVTCPRCSLEVRLHRDDLRSRYLCPRCRRLSKAPQAARAG